jgi:hypothetical protein
VQRYNFNRQGAIYKTKIFIFTPNFIFPTKMTYLLVTFLGQKGFSFQLFLLPLLHIIRLGVAYFMLIAEASTV